MSLMAMIWRKFGTVRRLQCYHIACFCAVVLGIFFGYRTGTAVTIAYQYSTHLLAFRMVIPIQQHQDSREELVSDEEYERKLLAAFPTGTKYEVTNVNLKKQKETYSKQRGLQKQLIRDNTRMLLWLRNYLVPHFECSTKVRVGSIYESAYFMCNPWVLATSNDCVVYSFGIQQQVAFEQDLFPLTNGKCRFYCFDNDPEDERIFKTFNGTFRHATISGRTNPNTNELAIIDIAKMHGHKRIDVLKVDIEGFEFAALPLFFRKFDGMVCHILIEFHGNFNSDAHLWIQLLRMLEKRGFRMFSKEDNGIAPRCVVYSFLHLSCFHQYGIRLESVLFTYFGAN